MINIREVTKSFNGNTAVSQLSLDIEEGCIYGLLGANGAGKSTTINMLLGFVSPDSGNIEVCGIDVIDTPIQAREQIGYIPENVNLYPYLTGLENLDYFCKLAGLRYTRKELSEILLNCGLQENAHRLRVSGYSKGMRQKVGIAIAYAKKAKVFLLDEPASGLDPLASNELSHMIRNLAAQGSAILMASHDIFRVRDVCHRIGILKDGVLIRELKSEDVSTHELEELYIEYMQS